MAVINEAGASILPVAEVGGVATCRADIGGSPLAAISTAVSRQELVAGCVLLTRSRFASAGGLHKSNNIRAGAHRVGRG